MYMDVEMLRGERDRLKNKEKSLTERIDAVREAAILRGHIDTLKANIAKLEAEYADLTRPVVEAAPEVPR